MLDTRKVIRSIGTIAVIAAGLGLLAWSGSLPLAATGTAPQDGKGTAAVVAGYGKLPLIFEANQGQTDARVKFLSRGPGYTLFLTPGEAVLSLRGADDKGRVLRVKLLGAKAEPKMTGLARLPGVSNYFVGRDRSKWRRGVPHYAKVGYEGVYPGIDLVFYGTNQRQLEYDFTVAPGADPGAIKLAFEGARRLEITDTGDLIAHLAGGEVRFKKPMIYQEEGAKRRPVAGGYALKDGRVTFDLAAYDRTKPLVIDPVLAYSTYLGGTDIEEYVRSIAVDLEGNAYVTGGTRSPDFPVAFAFQPSCTDTEGYDGCHDAFVTKLDPTGSTLVYSTYLGGASIENGWGIAVDAGGNAYVSGRVHGPGTNDFPTKPGAFQENAGSAQDGFFVKLDATGGLVYSTYLGGSREENAWDIAVDGAGRAYLTGETGSSDFPTTSNAFQPDCGLNSSGICGRESFLTVIDPSVSGAAGLVYSTFIGGSGNDVAVGVAVDGAGVAYVAGYTLSEDFPTTDGAFQVVVSALTNAFVSVIDPSVDGAGGLVYSSYLGGNANTFGRDVAVRPGCLSICDAYVTGSTTSDDFPTTADAVVPNYTGGGSDIFVTVIDPAGSGVTDLVYSTFFGDGTGHGIAVAANGNVYITGFPGLEIPIRDPLQPEPAGAFVAVIDPLGVGLEGGLLFSNPGASGAYDIAVDVAGDAYVVGNTISRDFPTTEDAFQTEISEEKRRGKPSSSAPPPDAFVVKIRGPFEVSGPVEPLNGAPIAVDDAYVAVEDTLLIVAAPGVLANDSDPDGDSLTTAKRSFQSDNGTVTIKSDGSFTYTPNADFNGTDSFTYIAGDGQALDSATVTITVTPVKDAPVATNDSYYGIVAGVPFVVPAPGVLGVLANDKDADGDALTAIPVSPPANGQVALQADGGFTYTANAGFSGTDTFTYKANDTVHDSNIATVSLFVSGGAMHIGDLDPANTNLVKTWNASAWVTVHDSNEGLVPNATVTVSVNVTNFENEVLSCTTGQQGYRCAVGVDVPKKFQSVTFTVESVTVESVTGALPYKPADNHDPDGDSDGTVVTVFKP